MNQLGLSLDCPLMGPIGAFTSYPHLGLCYLAGGIRRGGMSVDILDSAALGWTKIDQIISHVKEKRPRIIGITVTSMMLRECFKMIQANFRSQANNIVIEQLEYLLFEHNVKWIEFVDELFTIKRDRVSHLCGEIIRRGLDFRWGIQTCANMIDEELLVLMKKAGCRKISIGVETGSERIRYLDKKKVSDEDYFSFVRLCEKHQISTLAHYISERKTLTNT